MKRLIIFLSVFTATQSFAQSTKESTHGISFSTNKNQKIDTALRVIYVDKNEKAKQPAFFLNGKFVKSYSFVKPESIENINVIKGDTLIENKAYRAQIHIKTKSDYVPKLVSLADLKTKYTKFIELPVVFMIDGNLINSSYDDYFIDENILLTITIDKLEATKNNSEIGVIKLLTKTEENINSRNDFRIRGKEVAMN